MRAMNAAGIGRATVVMLVVVSVAGGCGASKPPEPSTASASASTTTSDAGPASAPAASTDPDAPVAIPTACTAGSTDVCTPDGDFVERLCAHVNQTAALALFAKATPFTRLYLKGKVDELVFDEEVLALRAHLQAKGGIQVGSGSGSYEVLRWDGSCSRAVEAEMLTKSRPPKPKTARVVWHRIDAPVQDAVIGASDAVKKAHAARGKECKGAMSGDVTASCERADAALVDAVVQYVRGGGSLPPIRL